MVLPCGDHRYRFTGEHSRHVDQHRHCFGAVATVAQLTVEIVAPGGHLTCREEGDAVTLTCRDRHHSLAGKHTAGGHGHRGPRGGAAPAELAVGIGAPRR